MKELFQARGHFSAMEDGLHRASPHWVGQLTLSSEIDRVGLVGNLTEMVVPGGHGLFLLRGDSYHRDQCGVMGAFLSQPRFNPQLDVSRQVFTVGRDDEDHIGFRGKGVRFLGHAGRAQLFKRPPVTVEIEDVPELFTQARINLHRFAMSQRVTVRDQGRKWLCPVWQEFEFRKFER